MTYRGDNLSKATVRALKWEVTAKLLGPSFHGTPHVFLASFVAGDAHHLLHVGVSPDNIWAVDSDPETWKTLFQKRDDNGFRFFSENITTVVERYAGRTRSVFLDFCGTLSHPSIKMTVKKCVRCLPFNSVLSLTVERGREHQGDVYANDAHRVSTVCEFVRANTRYKVKSAQVVYYQSKTDNSCGSPMMTISFWIGGGNITCDYIDIRGMSDADLTQLLADRDLPATIGEEIVSTQSAKKAWKTRRRNKEKKISPRSAAAYKAWETRRRNAANDER